jgi:hypothetical protein
MKDYVNAPHPPVPPAPQQAPQNYLQKLPSNVLQNPIPHQGVINTQQKMHLAPRQMGYYQNLRNLVDRNILLTRKEEYSSTNA